MDRPYELRVEQNVILTQFGRIDVTPEAMTQIAAARGAERDALVAAEKDRARDAWARGAM